MDTVKITCLLHKEKMKLTDTFLRSLKPNGKLQKHYDGGGLYLYVSPAGGRLWRMDYRFESRRKTLSIGAYPAVPLKVARQKRDEAKEHLARGMTQERIKLPSKPLYAQNTIAPMRLWPENGSENTQLDGPPRTRLRYWPD
ncbi:MAG: Arm DNA-binding domain-containing protein [Desulfovibrio sp.]|nr:Arm DNA-binding domain-containing protein [Desulfovibrio sp.]